MKWYYIINSKPKVCSIERGENVETVKKVLYPNLRAEMARRGDTLQDLKELLDLSEGAISRRLSGITGWSIEEANVLCKRYDVPFEILFVKE